MPKISVIVPIYNVAPYIERCVRSLMEQALDDVEFIFVNDSTPDDSVDIFLRVINEYPKRLPHVRLFHNETNLGLPNTRKKGLEHAHGKYIIHVDSDDHVAPQYLSSLYECAESENADITWCDFYKQDGKRIEAIEQTPSAGMTIEEEIKNLLLGKRQGALWNHLIRCEVYNAISFYPIHNMAEDLTILLQMYSSAHKLAYINAPLYYYCYNATSLSRADDGQQDKRLINQMREMEMNVNAVVRYFQAKGIDSTFHNEFVFRKFFNKRWVLPAIHEARHCSIWRNCHPDINLKLYGNRHITYGEKFTCLLVELGLYPWIRKIVRHR